MYQSWYHLARIVSESWYHLARRVSESLYCLVRRVSESLCHLVALFIPLCAQCIRRSTLLPSSVMIFATYCGNVPRRLYHLARNVPESWYHLARRVSQSLYRLVRRVSESLCHIAAMCQEVYIILRAMYQKVDTILRTVYQKVCAILRHCLYHFARSVSESLPFCRHPLWFSQPFHSQFEPSRMPWRVVLTEVVR